MLSVDEFLNDTIPGVGTQPALGLDSGSENAEATGLVPFKEPGYEGTIDYRIRQLSYSSLLTLHQCPRKFQLNRLRTTHRTEESEQSGITFSFGHVVGEAIQLALQGLSEDEIIWKMFLMWHTPDIFDSIPKDNKSFWEAVMAAQRFLAMKAGGFLNEYELVYVDGKPACELSFVVILPNGFRLRGFVDAVLVHRTTGKVIVLECKTTKSTTLSPALYQNSSQAVGYSVVLDLLFPGLASYDVLYLVYQTGSRDYTPMPFAKSYLKRASWIQDILMDVDLITTYETAQFYPQRGESCLAFFRECEYFNTCGLSTEYLTKPCTPEEEDKTDYQFVLKIEDLIRAQLALVEPA